MDRPSKGFVLIVGDGDFSLSLAFLERGNLKPAQIVSTSLETEESILKHKYAVDNIQLLKSKGVMVCFEVDARELHTDPLFEDRKFSRVIFNFPHSGGKSNHKKNRALLNDFFSSASQILDEDGEIMVTLCRGQGGTPADKPRREWHDSWQVVSMATNSNLILREVIPFNAEDYSTYNSTGFRSQDKGFNTEGAITHVFELSEPILVPTNYCSSTIKIDGQHFTCPAYIYHKINRNLLEDKNHPLKQVVTRFIGQLSSELKMSIEQLELPWYRKTRDITQGYILNQTQEKEEEKEIDTQEDVDKDNETEKGDNQNANNMNGLHQNSDEKLKMRTSLLEQLTDITSLALCESKCYFSAGITARPCVINPSTIPVLHQLLTVCPTQCLTDAHFESFVQTVYESLGTLNPNMNLEIQESGNCQELGVLSCDSMKNGTVICCNSNGQNVPLSLVFASSGCYGVLLFLDQLTQIVFEIPHMRLLWSKDPRFLSQFQDTSQFPVKFQPFYLYPMKFIHDLSLWEKEGEELSEIEMSNIVRNIAGDCVENIELIDKYQDTSTLKWSRCYRFTYISHDQALSYITSWKLQSLVRLQMAQKLDITLR